MTFSEDIIEDLIRATFRLVYVRNQVAHGRSANLESAVRMLRKFESSLEEAIRVVQRRLMIAKSDNGHENSLSQDNLFRVINDLKSSEAISTLILGGPGQGKTIYMKQMAFNFISNSRKTKNNVIPFYFNAKLISPLDQGFFEKSEAYSHLSDVIVEKLYSSIPNLINYLKRDDLTEFLDLFMKLGVDRSLLFVDGLDELGTLHLSKK